MNKIIKFLLIVICSFIIIIGFDLICIFTINRPILAIQARTPYTYTGLFYNTYNCPEYSMPQIKLKSTKFSCAVGSNNFGKVINIIDKTKNIDNFVCAEALEEFYQDDNYIYYWNCIKNNYIVVKYEDGSSELVSDALINGSITINELDNFNIKYIKYEK